MADGGAPGDHHAWFGESSSPHFSKIYSTKADGENLGTVANGEVHNAPQKYMVHQKSNGMQLHKVMLKWLLHLMEQ